MKYTDIVLTDNEVYEIKKFQSVFGQEWAEQALQKRQAQKYLATVCDCIQDAKQEKWTCYLVGRTIYQRKDKQPIKQEDIEAVSRIDKGQINKVYCDPTGLTVIHDWECDSSD